MKELIQGKHIIKTFGSDIEKNCVLRNVNIDINAGEFVAVMGPSGSGKSTLLFALSGIDTIDSGEILFENKSLSSYSEEALADLRRRQMGFVFQQPTLLKNLNVFDNILLPSLRDNRKNLAAIAEKAEALMIETGIRDLKNRSITQVSGGQLQRAGICRALMGDPQIIFGDEPTGALNSKSADEILRLLIRINAGGTAVMLATHDARAASLADRVLFMYDGSIVKELHLGKINQDADDRLEKVHACMSELDI